MMKRGLGLWAVCVALLLVAGCGEDPTPAPEPKASVTYHRDVRPLLEKHCVSCHQEGGIAPFALENPAQAMALGPAIVASVQSGSMPPFAMNDDCRELAESMRLSEAEKATFTGWMEASYPKGDPADFVAPPQPPAPEPLPDPDLLLVPEAPYEPDRSRADDYRCLILPFEAERDLFVTGAEVIPDRVEVVHHVIVYAVPPHAAESVRAFDEADPRPGYSCFGDAGVDEATLIGGWVPGSAPPEAIDPTLAQRIPQGSLMVMQMHYSTVNIMPDEPSADQTSVALWTLPEGQVPEYLLFSLPIFDLGIDIAPGDSASTHTSLRALPVEATVVSVSPHMHLLGKKMRTEILRPDGTVECLTDIDRWDFNWQRSYVYAEHDQVQIGPEDRVRLSCTYDNSAANQPVFDGEQIDPRQVNWGDGTYDEMCLDYLLVSVPYTGGEQPGVCAGFDNCLQGCEEGDGVCALTCMSGAGESCLFCGTEALFGDCSVGACFAEVTSLQECLDTCPATENDFFGCLYDHCSAPFEGYYACMEPGLRDGTCAVDFNACTGMTP